ncbi:MAG: DUF3795 domain-containing protein [Bacteroidales bacterium]|nr:DUF3795 domain-containing protein [Bacteroidales bacterium]MDD4669686.1 DUF3795 domain-containing protein [Bacteroidales bacterium]
MNKMIAICGLDCEKCDAYKATVANDDELRKQVAKLWSQYNNCEILPEHINCEGCRTCGKKTVFCDRMCEIRKCAIRKGHETCGQCDQMDSCPIVGVSFENDPSTKENLLSLQ